MNFVSWKIFVKSESLFLNLVVNLPKNRYRQLFACLKPVDDGEIGVVLLFQVVHLVVQLRDLYLQLGNGTVLLHALSAHAISSGFPTQIF